MNKANKYFLIGTMFLIIQIIYLIPDRFSLLDYTIILFTTILFGIFISIGVIIKLDAEGK